MAHCRSLLTGKNGSLYHLSGALIRDPGFAGGGDVTKWRKQFSFLG